MRHNISDTQKQNKHNTSREIRVTDSTCIKFSSQKCICDTYNNVHKSCNIAPSFPGKTHKFYEVFITVLHCKLKRKCLRVYSE